MASLQAQSWAKVTVCVLSIAAHPSPDLTVYCYVQEGVIPACVGAAVVVMVVVEAIQIA